MKFDLFFIAVLIFKRSIMEYIIWSCGMFGVSVNIRRRKLDYTFRVLYEHRGFSIDLFFVFCRPAECRLFAGQVSLVTCAEC